MLSPPLDKRNTRDKARGLCISSEGYIGELGVRCLSPIDRGQDSAQQSPLGKLAFLRQKHFNSLEHPLDVQCGHQRRLLVAPGGDPYDVGVIYRQDPCLVSCLMESWVETAERNV